MGSPVWIKVHPNPCSKLEPHLCGVKHFTGLFSFSFVFKHLLSTSRFRCKFRKTARNVGLISSPAGSRISDAPCKKAFWCTTTQPTFASALDQASELIPMIPPTPQFQAVGNLSIVSELSEHCVNYGHFLGS